MKNGWCDPKVLMPDPLVNILVMVRDEGAGFTAVGQYREVRTAGYVGGLFVINNYQIVSVDSIIAWQPLPEAGV